MLRVVKVFEGNRRVLAAVMVTVDANGNDTSAWGGVLTVRVKNNENFIKGMTLPAIHQTGRVWALARKLPRRRGHW